MQDELGMSKRTAYRKVQEMIDEGELIEEGNTVMPPGTELTE